MKLDVDHILERLFFLTLSDFPVNWLENTFQNKFSQFKKLECIDSFYEVFYPEFSRILKKNGKSVYSYIKEKPYSEYPKIKGESMNRIKATDYVNEIFKKLVEKYKKGNEKVKEFFQELKLLEKGNIPFEDIKPAIAWRPVIFQRNPLYLNKGTNLLIVLSLLYGIRKGDITGEGTEALERAIEVFSCFAANSLGLELEIIWKELNSILGSKYDIGLNCDKFNLH